MTGKADFNIANTALAKYLTKVMTSMLAISMPGGSEWIIIFILVFIFFGAKKLPELARGIGKSMGEFKKAREEFDHELDKAVKEEEAKKTAEPEKSIAKDDAPVNSETKA